jgi:hypothetical protein
MALFLKCLFLTAIIDLVHVHALLLNGRYLSNLQRLCAVKFVAERCRESHWRHGVLETMGTSNDGLF